VVEHPLFPDIRYFRMFPDIRYYTWHPLFPDQCIFFIWRKNRSNTRM